jgi:hypothetical protein
MSTSRSIETEDLTRSFGWSDSDGFQQHDVQELCRVLLDALEQVMKGTPNEKLIQNLWQGKLLDYVQCKECRTESSRSDVFQDLSLVIQVRDALHDRAALL